MAKLIVVTVLLLVFIELNTQFIVVRSWCIVNTNNVRNNPTSQMKCRKLSAKLRLYSVKNDADNTRSPDQSNLINKQKQQKINNNQRRKSFAQSLYTNVKPKVSSSPPPPPIISVAIDESISTDTYDELSVSTSSITSRVNKNSEYNSDSTVGSLHKQRVRTAGRVGTKRFIDPCKVYIGNLPFKCTDDDLRDFVCTVIGLPDYTAINQCKIVIDWKSNRSKGYGFVVMTDPIYATILIDKCDNNATIGSMEDRRLTVSQGKSLKVEQQLLLEEQKWLQKQQQRSLLSEEDNVIKSSTIEAPTMTEEEIRMLKRLDPDLVPDYVTIKEQFTTESVIKVFEEDQVNQSIENSLVEVEYDDDDDDDNDEDFVQEVVEVLDTEDVYNWEDVDGDEIYDDSDKGVDGIWYDNDDNNNEIVVYDEDDDSIIMNRAQRRNATALERKKRKLPNKGFG